MSIAIIERGSVGERRSEHHLVPNDRRDPNGGNEHRGRGPEVIPIVDGLIWKVDVRRILELAHPNWQANILSVARQAQEVTFDDSEIKTSVARVGSKTTYQPTDAERMKRELPWFYKFGKEQARNITAALFRRPETVLGTSAAAANLNYSIDSITGHGPHLDRNRRGTFMIYILTQREGTGGETVFYGKEVLAEKPKISPEYLTPEIRQALAEWDTLDAMKQLDIWNINNGLGERLYPSDGRPGIKPIARIRPEMGWAAVFAGHKVLHGVEAHSGERCTAPFDFVEPGTEGELFDAYTTGKLLT